MNFTDVILIAIACMSIPLVVAIFTDIFYAQKKQRQFSLRRMSLWYILFFGISFIPSIFLVIPNS
ncbi:hypothetical protein [Viridibacillus arvi]|jgi:hypothetical protein|uniref:Uncharacterized protein n=1 Tax=Viridibacillus arvi TaxID=263475 RepID=A0A0M0LA74_9BACL|nr:hypothetical protein [Viridibacillus arvi]KOO47980.1 hypothetical protein AMD00_20470 [Viridibacillus arvi]